MLKKLWNDDAGVVTLEYLVLGTFLGLALIVGVHAVATAMNTELTELSQAILTFNQTYHVSGFTGCKADTGASTGVDSPGDIGLAPVGQAGSDNTISVDICP